MVAMENRVGGFGPATSLPSNVMEKKVGVSTMVGLETRSGEFGHDTFKSLSSSPSNVMEKKVGASTTVALETRSGGFGPATFKSLSSLETTVALETRGGGFDVLM